MSKISTLAELFTFLKQNKKWWVLPIVLVLTALGAIALFIDEMYIAQDRGGVC